MARVDDLGLDSDGGAAEVCGDVQFGYVEAERVEPAYASLYAMHLASVELLDRGQFIPEFAKAALDSLDQNEWIQRLIQQTPSLEVAELSIKVGARNREVVLALPVGQTIMQLAGLSVHQVRGERTGVAPEQGVRQRDVTPQEAVPMQLYQQDDHGVDQSVDGVLAYAAAEQRPVRQGELQMPSDQNRVERLALFINTSCDHTHRLD